MLKTIVVAASENNVIGVNNQLPWHLSDDLKFFKKITLGKPVLMGRKTFESMGSRALPNRLNIVLSRQSLELPEEVLQFQSYPEAIEHLKKIECPELCIIGGGVIFERYLDEADQIYLTRVHCHIDDGTVFFPEIDPSKWEKTWEEPHPQDEKHSHAFTFQLYKKKA